MMYLFYFTLFACLPLPSVNSDFFSSDSEDLPWEYEATFESSGDEPSGKSMGEIIFDTYDYPVDDEDMKEFRRKLRKEMRRQQKKDGLIIPRSLLQSITKKVDTHGVDNRKSENKSTIAKTTLGPKVATNAVVELDLPSHSLVSTEALEINEAASLGQHQFEKELQIPSESLTTSAYVVHEEKRHEDKDWSSYNKTSIKSQAAESAFQKESHSLEITTKFSAQVVTSNGDLQTKPHAWHTTDNIKESEKDTAPEEVSTTGASVPQVEQLLDNGFSDLMNFFLLMKTTTANQVTKDNYANSDLDHFTLPMTTTQHASTSAYDDPQEKEATTISSRNYYLQNVTDFASNSYEINSSLHFVQNLNLNTGDDDVFWMENSTTHALVSTAIDTHGTETFPTEPAPYEIDGFFFIDDGKDFTENTDEKPFDLLIGEEIAAIGKSARQDVLYFNDDSTVSERSLQHVVPGPKNFNRCLVSPFPCNANENCSWKNNRVTCSAQSTEPVFCKAQECMNGGICYAELSGFRCVCPPGFSGQQCEISSGLACKSNPCQGNCKCIESCRHEYGYYCQGDGFIGKDCTIPVPKIYCEPNRMRIDVSRQFVRDFDRNRGNAVIYISPDPISSSEKMLTCKGHNVGDDYEFNINIPFDECGTKPQKMTNGKNGQIFRNRVWLDRHGKGWDMPVPLIDFECKYTREYSLVTSLKPVSNSPQLLQHEGKFSANLQLCKVASCPNACPQNYVVNGAASYTVGEMMYISVSPSTKVATNGQLLSIDQLFLSCDPNQAISPVHLISKGCQVGSGMFVRTKAGSTACISIQTPRPLSCSTVYLHVHVRSCSSHELQPCAASGFQKCVGFGRRGRRNKRRSVVGHSALSVIGPLLILNGSNGEESLKLFPTTNERLNSPKSIYKIKLPVEAPDIARSRVPVRSSNNQVSTALYIIVVAVCCLMIILVLILMYSVCTPRFNAVLLEDAT
ncbi:uncharacterized protein LOC144428186 [Styela clava]